jgi:ABC-type phosphate transport system ATPase subunit
MGPSGSGKTSLLNFMAQRLALSPGCKYSGELLANGREVKVKDFGKFGAFV